MIDFADAPASEEFRLEAKKMCQRCRELKHYTRDIKKELSDDLVKKYREEDKKSVDLVKNAGFVVAVSGAFVTALKNGLGTNVITVYEAAEAGVALSTAIVFRKKIISAFKLAGKLACKTVQQARKGISAIYSAGGVVVKKALKIRNNFKLADTELRSRIYQVIQRGIKAVPQLPARRKPQL